MIDWEFVGIALEQHNKGNDRIAENLLNLALGKGTDENPTEPVTEYHNYGLNGYTDENDVRGPHARSHQADESVHLIVHQCDCKYRVKFVDAIGNKNGNGGKHIATVKTPNSFHGKVVLATGYNGNPNNFDQLIYHTPGQEVVIDGVFALPNLGPLAIFLEENGKRVSDVVGNLGLPNGQHFSYLIEFV